MRVLAVDPGKTCGCALWEDGQLTKAGQCSWGALAVWAEEVVPMLDELVCEDFRVGPQTLKTGGDWRHPTAAIGVLRYWCEKAGVPFVLQQPAEAKSFSSDARLRALGWYHPSRGGHANDALRHLVLRLATLGELPLSTLVE